MLDFLRVDDDGIPRLDFSHITREQAAAIGEITVNEFESGRSDQGRAMRRLRIKIEKRAALIDLCKMLGVYRETVEVTKAEPAKPLDEFEAAKRIAFVLNSAIAAGHPIEINGIKKG